MKLHLPRVLFAAVLACMAAPAQAAFSYLAEGVNPADLIHSDRFYDNGKGLYWTYQYNAVYKGASSVYSSAGWTAFGKLYSRLVRSSSFSAQAFANLKDDGNTCGYQVPVNMIQYWQSYYGVFYKGSEELPYGFNYSREYLDDFGGTQSLELGMLFYDNWKNSGNNLQNTSRWYMKGETNSLMRNPSSGGGGYFADYYGSSDTCRYYDVDTLAQLKDALISGFALQQQSNGTYTRTEEGRLIYVGLSSPTVSGGHAITCYGFDLDASGNVKSMRMTNSDDLAYNLFTVYVKESGGHVYLYTDAACTTPWTYAGGSWYLNDLAHLVTPDILKQMYAVYSDADTPLTWNGEGARWIASASASTDALPTAVTGWNVVIGSDAYHSYYDAARPVRFDDSAASGNVSVYGSVSAPLMSLENTTLPYTFTGTSSAVIKAPQLCLSGGGSATFKSLTLSTESLSYSNYTLAFGSGSTLKAAACTLGSGGTLELAGGKATVTALTLGQGSTLAVTASGSSLTSSVTMEAGSELYVVLSSKQISASLFSVSGSLTLSGAVELEIGGASLVNGSTYMLCSVGSGSVDLSRLQSDYGDLSFSNKVLYLTYHALPTLTWSSGSGTWSNTQWQGAVQDTAHADVSFSSGSGTVTVAGAVNPHRFTMTGGSYTLSATDGAEASVTVDKAVTLSGSASLTSNIPLTAERYVLQGRSSLTLNTGVNQNLKELSMEAQTRLTLNGSGLTYTVGRAGGLSGTISVGSGATLAFRCAEDNRIGGTLTAADTTAALRFANASTTEPVTYRTGTSLSGFSGKVTVGAAGDSQGTTLSVEMMPSKGSYFVSSGSTLELACNGTLSSSVTGTGTLRIADGTQGTVTLSSGKPTYATTLALDVAGSLTIGSFSSVSKTAVARALTLTGEMTVYTGSGSSSYSSMVLDGGRYTVCMPYVSNDSSHIIGNIKALTVGEKGGTLSARHEGAAYYGQSYQATIQQLSGSGNLALEGEHFLGLTYYKLASLASSGYSGTITLHNTLSYTTTGNQVSLELGACNLPGSVMLMTDDDISLCRTTLGITDDAAVGGLDSDGRGSAYLYSGSINSFTANMNSVGLESQITKSAHTLTINATGTHLFTGKVLGPLHLVKDGSGTQQFSGDVSSWTGSLNMKSGKLVFDNALTMNGKLTMSGGTLQAQRLVTSAGASFSGAGTLVTGGVSSTTGWSFNVTLDNVDNPVLTLRSLSGSAALSLRSLSISYDPETVADGSYKLLQYNADFGGELKGITLSGDCLSSAIGSQTTSDVYFTTSTVGGKKVYTLMLDVSGASGVLPRYDAATLTWVPSSGEWALGSGHEEGTWSGSRNNNFFDGDTVIFNSAATVSLAGAVKPAAIYVLNSSGSVVLNAKGASASITGTGSLTKDGAGSLSVNTANSYSGGTTLSAGTLTAGNAAAFGTGAINVQGGTLAMGSYAVTNAVTATGGTLTGTAYKGVLTVQGNVSLGSGFKAGQLKLQSGTLSGSLTNTAVSASGGTLSAKLSGSCSVTSSGAVTLSGANTYTGTTTVNGGTLTAGSATAFGTGTVNLTGGTLALGNYAVSNAVSARSGTLSGSAYKGALTVSGGNVRLEDGFTAGSLTLGGGTLAFGGNNGLTLSGGLTIQASTQLDVSAYTTAGTYTLISANAISGSLSKLSCTTSASRLSCKLSQDHNAVLLQVVSSAADLRWSSANGTLSMGCVIGGTRLEAGDNVQVVNAQSLTLSGPLSLGELNVRAVSNLRFIADSKVRGSGLADTTALVKNGSGMLTLNAGNTYSGGTVLEAGTIKATAADSFGTGTITVHGGTLDLGGKAVQNDIVLSGAATLKGDAKYAGRVTVSGDATLMAKTSYKGLTTVGEDSTLTLTSSASMAGSLTLNGGYLNIISTKGLTVAKGATVRLNDGSIDGLLTVGAGSTLVWAGGTMGTAPVLKGGTLDLGGAKALTLTGSKAQVAFGDKVIVLPGKGIVRSDETLDVLSGTVKLTMGKETTDSAIKVSGNAALVNGATHSGDITVSGTLAKGTTIKLIDSKQTVELNGAGTMAGTISGIGTVNVNLDANASIDATAAKLTAAHINLNSGTFINTKGIKLAKGQILTLAGASVNLGTKGILTTAAGSTLKVSESTTLSGSLTLGGGELVFEGAALTVEGTLTLSKPVTVSGSGTLICGSIKPYKGSLSTLFGGAVVEQDGNTLHITNGSPKTLTLDAAPALPTVPAMPATNPVADAIAQADGGILDANRAFLGAVAARHQQAALLDKGQGAAWVSAFGSSVRHGNQGAHHGSDGNIEGAALGMEHSVSETGTVGLAVGRSKNRIGATGVSRLRQETAHAALYGQKVLRNGLIADATAAWGDTETKLGGSSWQQKSAALNGRLTHAHMVNDATAVRTFGGLCYEATESGSFGAAERSGSVQNLRAEVGAGASHAAGKAHFYGEASLTGDLIRHNPSVELGGIRHHGATPGRVGVKATLGSFYEITDTWTGTASYSVEAESRTTSHTLNLGVSKSF